MTQGEQQWVVVCLDSEYGAPAVYAAWDSETEAATWLDEQHLTVREDRSDDDSMDADAELPLWCENGGSEFDHFVVTAIDSA